MGPLDPMKGYPVGTKLVPCPASTRHEGRTVVCELLVPEGGDHRPYPHDALVELDRAMMAMNPGAERLGEHLAWP